MSIENQDSLFDQDPTESRKLSPSEEFALAHPDFQQPAVPDRNIDPNARRAAQLEEVGGGIASALKGELESPEAPVVLVRVVRSVPVKRPKRRTVESRYGDQERDISERPLYFDEPEHLSDEDKETGKSAILDMRDKGILKNPNR